MAGLPPVPLLAIFLALAAIRLTGGTNGNFEETSALAERATTNSRRVLHDDSASPSYCMSPALRFFVFYYDPFNPRPEKGCDQLRGNVRARCRLCASQASRSACLKTTGRVWNGQGDRESCLWVTPLQKQQVTEQRVAYALNDPAWAGLYARVSPNVSSIRFEHKQLRGPGWDQYRLASFAARGYQALPAPRQPKRQLPAGLHPERACFFTRRDPELRCRFTYHNAPGNTYVSLSKAIYTDSPRILEELATSQTCNSRATCIGTSTPFLYEMKMTEKYGNPCPVANTRSSLVFGLGSKAMGAGGGSYASPRAVLYDLTGGSKASWSVRSSLPMLVLRLNETSLRACPPPSEGVVACDYTSLRSASVSTPACFSDECEGSYTFPAKATGREYLHISYPWFFNSVPYNPEETPQTKVYVDIDVTP